MDALNTFISSGALFILFVIVVAILCLREIRCWYWKITDRVTIGNQQVNLLIEIIDNQDEEIKVLREILGKLTSPDGINIEYIEEAAATEENPE